MRKTYLSASDRGHLCRKGTCEIPGDSAVSMLATEAHVDKNLRQIWAYAKKELGEYEEEAVKEHLSNCALCREALEGFEDVLDFLGDFPEPSEELVQIGWASVEQLAISLLERESQLEQDEQLRKSYSRQGRYEEAYTRFRELRDHCLKEHDAYGIAALFMEQAGIERQRGRYLKALTLLEEAKSLYISFGDLLSHADCLLGTALIRQLRGMFRDSLSQYRCALDIYEHLGENRKRACCLIMLGDLYRENIEPMKARRCYQVAERIMAKIDDHLGQAFSLMGIGKSFVLLDQGHRANKSFSFARQVFAEVARFSSDNQQRAAAMSGAGYANYWLGRCTINGSMSYFETAQARFSKAFTSYEKLSHKLGQADCLMAMGELAGFQEFWCDAEKLLQAALELYEGIRMPLQVGHAMCRLAEVASAQGHQIDAERFCRNALVHLDATDAHEAKYARILMRKLLGRLGGITCQPRILHLAPPKLQAAGL